MDETFQNYVNRVARLTLPATYQSQFPTLQKSPKFAGGEAVLFPGYSVITPPWQDDRQNNEFYDRVRDWQSYLSEKLRQNFFIPVDPNSFHLTLADLIWDNNYQEAVKENSDFDRQLKEEIQKSFARYREIHPQPYPTTWQLLGLMVRPRAIAVCLVPKDNESYQPIFQLRRSIYQNSDLIALGIEQQYNFTAHVTIGYFGDTVSDVDSNLFTEVLCSLNDSLLEMEAPSTIVDKAEFRKFEDMIRYYREADWPTIEI